MDRTTELISSYALSIEYSGLPPATVHETKRRIIDSLGCAMGGFDREQSRQSLEVLGKLEEVDDIASVLELFQV